MTIKAIETHYRGHRFRSRLEARWAVWMDSLGIRWEYEPQGYHCTYRLTQREGTFPYLPDFWLPDLNVWAEVKGSLTVPELVRLLDAAASLSSNDGEGCGSSNGGHDLVVMGPVPSDVLAMAPWRLHMHKGILHASGWNPFGYGGCDGLPIAYDSGPDPVNAEYDPRNLLLNGCPIFTPSILSAANTIARKARFEHGEAG